MDRKDRKKYAHIISLSIICWVELQSSGHRFCISPKGNPANQYSPPAFREPHLNFLHILSQFPWQWPKIHSKNIKGLTEVKGKRSQTKPTPPSIKMKVSETWSGHKQKNKTLHSFFFVCVCRCSSLSVPPLMNRFSSVSVVGGDLGLRLSAKSNNPTLSIVNTQISFLIDFVSSLLQK